MFSVAEKRKISEAVEKVLLELKHPEMPEAKPKFALHVGGKESWSFADIQPNWVFDGGKEIKVNPWNEQSHKDIKEKSGTITAISKLYKEG